MPELLNREDAARYIGVSVRTLNRLVERGKIPRSEAPGPKGNEARFDTGDLDRYIQANRPAALLRQDAPSVAPLVPRQDAPLDATLRAASQTGRQSPAFAALAAFGASSKLLLSLADVRALTGLSDQFLRDAIHAGKLKGKIIGKGYKVKRADLEKFIAKL
jgi:excisionase family DNA binding protein